MRKTNILGGFTLLARLYQSGVPVTATLPPSNMEPNFRPKGTWWTLCLLKKRCKAHALLDHLTTCFSSFQPLAWVFFSSFPGFARIGLGEARVQNPSPADSGRGQGGACQMAPQGLDHRVLRRQVDMPSHQFTWNLTGPCKRKLVFQDPVRFHVNCSPSHVPPKWGKEGDFTLWVKLCLCDVA